MPEAKKLGSYGSGYLQSLKGKLRTVFPMGGRSDWPPANLYGMLNAKCLLQDNPLHPRRHRYLSRVAHFAGLISSNSRLTSEIAVSSLSGTRESALLHLTYTDDPT